VYQLSWFFTSETNSEGFPNFFSTVYFELKNGIKTGGLVSKGLCSAILWLSTRTFRFSNDWFMSSVVGDNIVGPAYFETQLGKLSR